MWITNLLSLDSSDCYGMNDQQQIEVNIKTLEAENRGAGGIIIYQAPRLIKTGNTNGFNACASGIDGGTRGCACEWRN
jgi:hypothetical protein